MNKKHKYVVARCPNCGASAVFSDDPRDKLTIKLLVTDDNYHGKTHLCAKCKKMYAIVDLPKPGGEATHVMIPVCN